MGAQRQTRQAGLHIVHGLVGGVMEKGETKKLLEVLRIAYPNAYKGIAPKEAQATLELYHSRFKDYPAQLVVEALNAYIDENEYPPTVAGIKKYILRFSGEKDYDALFNELWQGICGNLKFIELSPANQKYIGGQKALDDLGADERTVMEVVRGQYMRRIAEIVEGEKFDRQVKQRIGTENYARLQAQMNEITNRTFGFLEVGSE